MRNENVLTNQPQFYYNKQHDRFTRNIEEKIIFYKSVKNFYK